MWKIFLGCAPFVYRHIVPLTNGFQKVNNDPLRTKSHFKNYGNDVQESQRWLIIGKKDQYRSSFIAFKKLLPELQNAGFEEQHEAVLKTTPFWSLYNTYKVGLVTEALYSKSDKVLLKLIQCFNRDDKAFRIGGQVLKFRPSHMANLLGLPNTRTQLKLHTK